MRPQEAYLDGRSAWIDIAKGAGIILVVIAHVGDHATIPGASTFVWAVSLFHMPLFFVITGYLFKPATPSVLFTKRIRTLLIPYAAFLLSIIFLTKAGQSLATQAPPTLGLKEAARYLWGGALLTDRLGVFWFVPCLFGTQLAYNFAARRWPGAANPRLIAAVLASVTLGYLIAMLAPSLRSPLAITLIPFAIGSYWFGHYLRETTVTTGRLGVAAAATLAICGAAAALGLDFSLTMKYAIFGPFLLGLALALALSWLFLEAMKRISGSPLLANVVTQFGRASLVIMFVHQFVHFTLRDLGVRSDVAIVLLAILIPYLIYLLMEERPLLSRIYLGQDIKAASGGRQSYQRRDSIA
jgi:fucose 4-O-acetylase-like acetyltransferase